ncbi:MAG: hypothetical protein AAB368_06865, partial [bacterium]
MSALDEILTWSASAPAWLRDALRRIVSSSEITDADIARLAELCMVPHGLSSIESQADPLSPKDTPAPVASEAGVVAFTSITHVSDVNALAPNET